MKYMPLMALFIIIAGVSLIVASFLMPTEEVVRSTGNVTGVTCIIIMFIPVCLTGGMELIVAVFMIFLIVTMFIIYLMYRAIKMKLEASL